jgi:hypothetical protein
LSLLVETMTLSAIGTAPAFNPTTASGASTGGLEAQIARYTQELSDCVNCASANTAQGQARIAEIASKISRAKARIDKIASQKPAPDASHTAPANKTATPTGATTPPNSDSLYVPGSGATQSVIPAQVPGIRVSVYA